MKIIKKHLPWGDSGCVPDLKDAPGTIDILLLKL
jgi:hypothetical protein